MPTNWGGGKTSTTGFNPTTGGWENPQAPKPQQQNPQPDWSVAPPPAPQGTSGTAQPQLSSLNNSGPSAGEEYFDANKGAWTTPSFGEVNNQGLVGVYSDPNNRSQTTNNSQGWFNQYQKPDIATEPGFGAYFDNAKNRAAESINQTMAARGAYGSSAANDQTARAFTDLDAQRALKEADYNLQRLAEQRAWEGLGGQLAGAADSSALSNSKNEQDWVGLLSRLGIDASRLGLDRTNAGADAANAAGAAKRQRGQDYFNNQLAMGDRLSDIYRTVVLPALDNDAVFRGDASSGGVAEGNQTANNERTNTQDNLGYLNTAASLYNQFYGPK
jgi:hypothetical protein